jgi:hypothetical protein
LSFTRACSQCDSGVMEGTCPVERHRTCFRRRMIGRLDQATANPARRRTPSSSSSVDVASDRRTQPSPAGSNAVPGVTATPADAAARGRTRARSTRARPPAPRRRGHPRAGRRPRPPAPVGEQGVALYSVRCTHCRDDILLLAESGQRSHLRRRVHPRQQRLLQLAKERGRLGRYNEISPPPGHRIRLGKAVAGQHALRVVDAGCAGERVVDR